MGVSGELTRILEGLTPEEIKEALEARLPEDERYELGRDLLLSTARYKREQASMADIARRQAGF